MMTVDLLAFVAVIALIPAAIAHRKGRSFPLWWLFGFALWIVATPASLMIRDRRRTRCPSCAESVSREASVCPHCRSAILLDGEAASA